MWKHDWERCGRVLVEYVYVYKLGVLTVYGHESQLEARNIIQFNKKTETHVISLLPE